MINGININLQSRILHNKLIAKQEGEKGRKNTWQNWHFWRVNFGNNFCVRLNDVAGRCRPLLAFDHFLEFDLTFFERLFELRKRRENGAATSTNGVRICRILVELKVENELNGLDGLGLFFNRISERTRLRAKTTQRRCRRWTRCNDVWRTRRSHCHSRLFVGNRRTGLHHRSFHDNVSLNGKATWSCHASHGPVHVVLLLMMSLLLL